MITRTLPAISRWVMAGALLALLPFVESPFPIIVLAVLGLHLSLVRVRPAPYELLVALLTLTSVPFVASSIWPRTALLGLAIIPGLPWLSAILRRVAVSTVAGGASPTFLTLTQRLRPGRQPTPYLLALLISQGALALVGFVAAQPVLVGTAVTISGFLAFLIVLSSMRMPPGFLAAHAPTIRVLARDTAEASVVLSSRARMMPVGLFLEQPHGWVRISPVSLEIDRGEARVRVKLVPPLSGPSTIAAWATAIDPWGLMTVRQEVDLIHLRVIPRAAYAAWLARRYLEQSQASSRASPVMPAADAPSSVRRGLDYYGARSYEPGDVLRDIFWKHTLKLGQLVMKERRAERGDAVILAVNLSARTPEEVDSVGYRLLMSATTLAQDGVPLTFAAYTPQEIAKVTPPLAPREAVLQALRLVEEMRIAPRPVRLLQPPRVPRLRRTIARLEASGGGPASRLAGVLRFEHRVLHTRALAHPVFAALSRASALTPAPAAVLLVAADPEEVEALDATFERLRARGLRLLELPMR